CGARHMYAGYGDMLLRIAPLLFGWFVGTKPVGNVVPLADGSGSMFIAPASSSFANLSLAVLSAAIFVNLRSGRWSRASIGWALASASVVITINGTRIGLIGLYPSHYALLHGPVGAAVAAWLTLIAIVAIGYHRIGHDAPYAR